MPDIWVPNTAAESILHEQFAAEGERLIRVERRLQALDPRLGMFRARVTDPENQLREGYWYVFRRNEDGTMAFWEVRDPFTDGYYEPDEGVVEMFRRWDANTPGSSAADRDERRRQAARKREASEREWSERNYDRLLDEADYLFRVQVPVSKKPGEKVST